MADTAGRAAAVEPAASQQWLVGRRVSNKPVTEWFSREDVNGRPVWTGQAEALRFVWQRFAEEVASRLSQDPEGYSYVAMPDLDYEPAAAREKAAAVPEIEFHDGKRPREMTMMELLVAINHARLPHDDRWHRWLARLTAEFDGRRSEALRTAVN